MLTSLQNPTVKHLVKMRDNRMRRRAGRVLVDGWRETQRAIESGLKIAGIYVCRPLDDDASVGPGDDAVRKGSPMIAGQAEAERVVMQAAGGAVVMVSPAVMEKISYGQSDRGIVADFFAPEVTLDNLRLPDEATVLVLDHFEKPGNLGAVFRSADAAGVDAVIVCPAGADRFNPNAIRSSLGAVFTVPSASVNESDAREWLIAQGCRMCAARVQSSRPLWQADMTGRLAIIIGSERDGLGDHWQSRTDSIIDAVRIPMSGSVDSLNASVSAAVLIYEAARQRARA